MAAMTLAVPKDWTNGSGVFPAGNQIVLPPNQQRQALYVQNQDVGTVAVSFAAVAANNGNPVTASIILGPAPTSGGMGGADERNAVFFCPIGAVTITGAVGQKVCVLEA